MYTRLTVFNGNKVSKIRMFPRKIGPFAEFVCEKKRCWTGRPK
jgi:hypothetical protein